MRLIDADALLRIVNNMTFNRDFADVKALINASHTIDAEPVVRCKDCKHFMEFTETFRERIKFDGSCRLLVGFTDCDREMRKYTDYCSYGERKMSRGMKHE